MQLGDTPFTVSATSNSTGAITYSVISGLATLSASTGTLTGAGTVVLQASQASNGNYSWGHKRATFTVAVKESCRLLHSQRPLLLSAMGTGPITLSASANSGLAVTFSVLSGPASVSGNTLAVTGAGTVVVAADQTGNPNPHCRHRGDACHHGEQAHSCSGACSVAESGSGSEYCYPDRNGRVFDRCSDGFSGLLRRWHNTWNCESQRRGSDSDGCDARGRITLHRRGVRRRRELQYYD